MRSVSPVATRAIRFCLLLLAVLSAAWMTGCSVGGVPLTAKITPLEVVPAEVTLDAAGTATVRLSFGVSVSGADTWNAYCNAATGLPTGVMEVERAFEGRTSCNSVGTTASVSDAAFAVVVTLQTALGVAPVPGRYTVSVPLGLNASVNIPVGNPVLSQQAEMRFVLVVPGVAPPPPPPPTGSEAWMELGGSAGALVSALNVDATSYTQGPALVTDGAGNPVASWVENDRVVVRRWEGSAWQTLSPGLTGAIAMGRPALARDATAAPVVAWNEARTADANGPRRVQVRRWDGSVWQPMGTTPVDAPDTIDARDPALLWRDGELYLAWAERTTTEGGERIALRRWNGSDWVPAFTNGDLPMPGRPARVTLTALDGGTLALGWQDDADRRVRVHGLQGSSWVPLANFASPNAQSFGLAQTSQGLLLAIAPGFPTTQFTVQRYTGSGWAPFGSAQGQPTVTTAVAAVALGTEAVTGAPLLAWIQFDTSRRFEVRRWSGSDWAAMGEPVPSRARTAPGTPTGLALAGGQRLFLVTEVSTTLPDDRAIRVHEFR